MRVVLSKSTEEAVDAVVTILTDHLGTHPNAVIGLASGRTMEPVYQALAKQVIENNLVLDQSFYFMLDEYVGLPEGHPSSFMSYMKRHLLEPLSLKISQFAFPPVHSTSLQEAGARYELNIAQSGGIDIQLLGLGQNGHVGFNEPGSSKESVTRLVSLTKETIEANRSQFSDGDVPQQALSMGIKTIMNSKSLVMLATGKSKAEVIKYLFNHHDDPTCPASFLKSHAHFTLVLDPEAASKINLKI